MGKTKDTGIRARLIKSYVQTICILGGAALLAVVALFIVAIRFDHALTYYGFSQGDIGRALTAFTETRSAVRGAIGYDKQDEVEKLISVYNEKKQEFIEGMKVVEATTTSASGKETHKEIMEEVAEYWELCEDIMEQGSSQDKAADAQAQARAFSEMAPAFAELYSDLEEMMNENVAMGDKTKGELTVLVLILLVTIVGLVAAGVIVSMRIGKKIAAGIENPLAALSTRLNAFSHGDLHSPFPVLETKDEIADIVEDCRDMAENLNEVISDAGYLLGEMAEGDFTVRTSIEHKYEGDFSALILAMRKLNRQLDATLRQIREASEQVSEGASQLAGSAQELAEGATEQAGAVEELTATVENVTSISMDSADGAVRAATEAKSSADSANKSREDMEELTVAMERITATSREIENIIGAIEDIASQTNLLSLNASIEAARAGEAGRGFAVVADQIGKLAADSAQSAVNTKALIEKSLEEVNKGNEIVKTSMETISGVLASMENLAGMAGGAAEASKDQAEMLQQVEGGIEQIATVVQSNSATSQETSAISEELSAQAVSLMEMVEAFKLSE